VILFGYHQKEMLTYIILITFLNAVVLSTTTAQVAQEIQDGSLSVILLRPVNYFAYCFSRDAADKCMNTFFSLLELVLLYFFLKPDIIIQTQMEKWIPFVGAIGIAIVLYFCINMLLSFIGFWSREAWAPRFIFFILVTFLAGIYFPLDILPAPIYTFMRLLPFTYLVYFPLKIYLGQISSLELLFGFTTSLVWCFLLIFAMKNMFKKGIKLYTAEGI
jgi:ABC-2 type transport system permease protein